MSRLFGVSNNTVNGGYAAQGTLTDEEAQWCPVSWNYYRRTPRAEADQNNFYSLWPRSSYFMADPSTPGVMQLEAEENWDRQWDFNSADGHNGQKFIIGTTKDSGGNAVASVVVKSYLTSNDLEVGQTTSGSDGSYRVGTPYTGSHYVVGYLAGGTPTAGTSVNTLTPTNNDGT